MKKNGNSSLHVKMLGSSGTSGSAYRMLAVTAPMNAFWVRFFIRSDVDFSGDHNAFAKASDSDDPNGTVNIEFAEDVGIAFNTSDAVVRPDGYGYVNGGKKPYSLPKDTWHCVEISYDGTNRVQQLFINGSELINATNYPASLSAPIKIFKFGFQSFHGPERNVWYDDVAVAPTKIGGCN